jgi:flagellar biosynthesis/type III secretory pathway M-ring protein FliF/YscJ
MWDRLKGGVAVGLALLVLSFGVRPVRADAPDRQNTPAQATDNERPPTEDTGPEGSSGTSSSPQLQLQDEPTSRDADFSPRSRPRASDEVEERPFWKNWIFWTVTGVLVAGIVGMVVYTSTGSNSSLAPCPADVVVSLGCYGTGR